MAGQRIRVGVLFGGRSCEHEVSVASARSVLGAIDVGKYEPIPIGVTKQGEWIRVAAPALADPAGGALIEQGQRVALLPQPESRGLVGLDGPAANDPTVAGDLGSLDVVFPLIHGPLGEDGTVQGVFELAGIPYVGSGVLGSAVGMDKSIMKGLFEHRGLPVAPYRTILRKRWRSDPRGVRAQCESAFPYPWFVKPANLGSSVGVCKVRDRTELAAAMDEAARYDRKLIVEASVEGAREIEVAVLGNDEPEASVPGEILPEAEFYDYRAKYVEASTRLVVPAAVPDAMRCRLRSLALEAFRALDCAGLARVDFLVRGADGAIFVNEVNTLPGFTPVSMYPRLWEATGLPYRALIDRLIGLGIERHADRQENETSFIA